MLLSLFMMVLISGATYLWSPAQDVTRESIEHCVIWMMLVASIWVAVNLELSRHIIGASALIASIVALPAIFVF